MKMETTNKKYSVFVTKIENNNEVKQNRLSRTRKHENNVNVIQNSHE